jgi:ubiquinone biosynthesis monooxygenase Coq7
MAVLRANSHCAKLVARMAGQEKRHLERFDRMVAARGVRPTALQPIWNVAGFALGAATALMSEQAAMACTEAVETEIDLHYSSQLDAIGEDDPELSGTIAEFRAEELEHRDIAREAGAAQAVGYPLLTAAVRAGCRLAIGLSERI